MARPRKIPKDEAEARLLKQKRESYERHREKRKEEMRAWYRENQADVRAQQSRYKEAMNAWKYQQRTADFLDTDTIDEGWRKFARSNRWHGTLGGTADRLSIINELELREPNYIIQSPRRKTEIEAIRSEDPLNWVHEFDRTDTKNKTL